MTYSFDQYLKDRGRFAVNREQVQRVLSAIQPLALELLGRYSQRHILWDGELPVNPIMTTPETAGGWGELMPIWFSPSDRPMPLYCLDNWALFAGLYQRGLTIKGDEPAFSTENLLRILLASDLLMPFMPSTDGSGHFLQNGAMTILLGVLWLDEPDRAAWLDFHRKGAEALRKKTKQTFESPQDVGKWLTNIEMEAFLVPEFGTVAGEDSVKAFLEDAGRYQMYQSLFESLSLSVIALYDHYGPDWREWSFQMVNVHYRTPGFGLEAIAAWMKGDEK